ncbi:hypothetical protein PT286_02100 [Neisseriaceae bacterium ESL0693]|nr:hypothetical protein [Neisseriaceae bacterium ESL0693]
MSNNNVMNGLAAGWALASAKENGEYLGYQRARKEMNGQINQAFNNGRQQGWNQGYQQGWNEANAEIYKANAEIARIDAEIDKANAAFREKNAEIRRLSALLAQHGIHA